MLLKPVFLLQLFLSAVGLPLLTNFTLAGKKMHYKMVSGMSWAALIACSLPALPESLG